MYCPAFVWALLNKASTALAVADVVLVYQLPVNLAELGAKLSRELREGAVVVSNAYPIPLEGLALKLIREVPVATEVWNPDGSSSLWLYRVSRDELPNPRDCHGASSAQARTVAAAT